MFRYLRTISFGKWVTLKDELRRRLLEPLGDPTYVLYFLIIIVGVGGIGIWLAVGKAFSSGGHANMMAVPQSLATYLVAIAAASFVDLTFLTFSNDANDTSNGGLLPEETRLSLWMVAISMFLGAVALALISSLNFRLRWTYGSSVAGAVTALLSWWIANYSNKKLRLPSPEAVAGGNTDAIEGSAANVQQL